MVTRFGEINELLLTGNLLDDPRIRTMNSGRLMAKLDVASNVFAESLRLSHSVVVVDQFLVNLCRKLKKGQRVFLKGALTYKHYNYEGKEVKLTEILITQGHGVLYPIENHNLTKSNPDDYGYYYEDENEEA
jgi:single-stranded DNA-binding protein